MCIFYNLIDSVFLNMVLFRYKDENNKYFYYVLCYEEMIRKIILIFIMIK